MIILQHGLNDDCPDVKSGKLKRCEGHQIKPKPIRIVLDGGIIQDVLNLPSGFLIEVYDYSVDGTPPHPNLKRDEKGKPVWINTWGEGQ
jgi:hypothetical protein